MVARRESATDRTKVGGCGGVRGEGESRVFRCKTCLKEFSSFQALGGHSVSHKKQLNEGKKTSHTCSICGAEFRQGQALGGHMRKHRNEKERTEGSLEEAASTKPMTSHTCSICGAEFRLGNALGGHMRKHRNDKERTEGSLEEEASTVTTLNKSNSGRE